MDSRTFTPLPWQIAPWADTRKTMVLAGGAGSGKSVFALHKMNAACLRYPGSLWVLLRKARQHLRNSSIPMYEGIVGGQVLHEPSKNRFQYPNGSRVVYGGMFDQKQREALRSIAGEQNSGIDGAVMEEGSTFAQDDYEELTTRLRGMAAPWRQIIIATNPDSASHWINQLFIKPHHAGKLKNAGVYQPRPEDNPIGADADYLETLRNLTGVRRDRMYLGKWVRAEGTVFDSWDPDKHIVEWFPVPKHWPRYRSIDLGYINPRVCLWGAVDVENDGCLYIYRQTYKTKQLARDHAKEMIRISCGDKFEATTCDHDAEERADYESNGVTTVRARKDVELGIQVMQDRITAGKLKIMRGCLVDVDEDLHREHKPWCTEQEFDCYVWKRNPDGTITKEEPEKKNDHGMDTLRYLCMYLDRDNYVLPADAPSLGSMVERYSALLNQDMEVF